MKSMKILAAGMAAALATAASAADCTLSSDAGVTVRDVSPANPDGAHLVVSMSLLPKMLHVDYVGTTSKGSACDMDQFDVGGLRYDLYGEDGKGRTRKAIPAKKGAPAATLVAIVDLMKAIDASKQGKPTPSEGYMLATLTKEDLTGWRLYSGMPDQATLMHDMAEVLAGQGKPLFRTGKDGKTSLFLGD